MCINKEKTNDYIIVGEQRDAEKYIQAANTGHLVFTTIAQHNAIETYKRLEKLGIKK